MLPVVTLSGRSVVMDGAHAALFHYPLVAYGAVMLSFVGALPGWAAMLLMAL